MSFADYCCLLSFMHIIKQNCMQSVYFGDKKIDVIISSPNDFVVVILGDSYIMIKPSESKNTVMVEDYTETSEVHSILLHTALLA